MVEFGFSLKDANIAIIGLGLMGGSMALSLKGNCRHLIALDTDMPTLDYARRLKMVDFAASDPKEALMDANIIILACPIPAIIDWLERLPDFIKHPCIVLDMGSTKRAILRIMEALPENFDPIGGHTICGKESLSIMNADSSLYSNAPFFLIPLSRTGNYAREAGLQIAHIIGAKPMWTEAETHDRILAVTSHLPYLLSSALTLIAPDDAADFAGPGFRSSTRLAGTSSSMMLGVLESNKDNIQEAFQRIHRQLDEIEFALMENDIDKLKSLLDLAQSRYQTFIQ